MPNSNSAKKRLRQAVRRTEINRSIRSRMRTFVRKVEDAIENGNKEAALTAIKNAQPEIIKSANKGIIKHNSASRKISRLTQRINSMGE